ncbi:MAG: EcsC family protein [Butyricicoccaceae bacterium]
MTIFSSKTPMEKELERLERQERRLAARRAGRKESRLNQLLADKVPDRLQSTLNAAFSKAFVLIFEKGTGVIEKIYKRDELEKAYQVNEYAAEIHGDRKTLRAFSKKAGSAGTKNLILSGVSGIGLGILGIGIPDIVLFTGLMLKGIYEIALNYGFPYEIEGERQFILYLIQGAVSCGAQQQAAEHQIDQYIRSEQFREQLPTAKLIEQTAGCLSGELLYMKFLQGIPMMARSAVPMMRFT